MLAAENGALPQGKVGGMGDVTRDLPRALVAAGHDVTVMTPAYGLYTALPGAARMGRIAVPFAGATRHVDRYLLAPDAHGVRHEVLDHPDFSPTGPGEIYCNDFAHAPFHTDATKFSFFSAAGAAVAQQDAPDIVHLHDWHLGVFAALRRFDRRFAALRKIRTVFTIHNLSLQGTRPFGETDSAWTAWFPWLGKPIPELADPRYADCVNPMAMGIRLADMITTVSPNYALEVQQPNDPASGFHGGEGLESDLIRAAKASRLIGILNGCSYATERPARPKWLELQRTMGDSLRTWIAREQALRSTHYLAEQRLQRLPERKPALLLTSVGRLTAQKSSLFRESADGTTPALEQLLEQLPPSGLFVMVGSGEPGFERFFAAVAARHENFLFLNGYSDALADALYESGDLFLMPSSFEPCGISQMLAMRAGQPCVAHAVGGLKDTVGQRNGFPFGGATPREQASEFLAAVTAAIKLRHSKREKWNELRKAAAAERFDWATSAKRYLSGAYGIK